MKKWEDTDSETMFFNANWRYKVDQSSMDCS
jgi:hypothetical protein